MRRPLAAALAALALCAGACAPLAAPALDTPSVERSIREHPVALVGVMTHESVVAVERALEVEKAAGRTVVLTFDSPGGSADAGIELHDWLRASGPVTCVVTGVAASAAFVALQGCSVRVALPGAELLIHDPFFILAPSPFPRTLRLGDLRELLAGLQRTADETVARCARSMRMTRTALRNRLSRGDWDMTSSEALRAGAVDSVVPMTLAAPEAA